MVNKEKCEKCFRLFKVGKLIKSPKSGNLLCGHCYKNENINRFKNNKIEKFDGDEIIFLEHKYRGNSSNKIRELKRQNTLSIKRNKRILS